MAEYIIVYWKDIPGAVEAGGGDAIVRVPGHLHFAAVVADLALCPAPAITPTVPMAAMSGPAHGRGVLLHHLG